MRINVNEQLAEELHEPVIKKCKKRKVCARFKNNIWAEDLAKKVSLSSKNKNVKYLLYAIDVFKKGKTVFKKDKTVKKDKKGKAVFKKDKKGKTVLNAFIKIVNESNRKPNKLWVDQGKEFYNKLMQE